MMTIDQIRTALKGANASQVSRATGLSYNTIRNIRNGHHTNPTIRVLQVLSAHLKDAKARSGQ